MSVSTEPKPGVDGSRPLAAVGAGVTLMGIGSVIARASGMDGPLLALNRSWLGAVVYLAVLLLGGRRIGVKQFRLAGLGGAAFGAQIALFYSSIQMTTVANATMIMALHPVVVLVVYAARFGEPTRSRDWLLSSVAMAGIGLVVFGSSESSTWSPVGDLLAVASLAAWSIYFAASKRARATLGAVEYQGLLLVSSALVLLPVTVILSRTVDPGVRNWPWVAAMVIVPGTGHLLINWAHPKVALGLVSQLTLASPIVSVLVATAALDGESINGIQIAGMALVMVALGQLVKFNTPTNQRENT